MNDNKYWIIIKTGEAEIRALENVPKDILSKTIPLIEITRGRKVTKNNIETYPFDKRIAKLKEIYKGNTIAIDVTSEEALSSSEVDSLYSPDFGYKNWIDFLLQLKDENISSMVTLSEESRRMQDMMKMYGMSGMDPSMFGTNVTLVLNANNNLVKYVLDHKDDENTNMICEQLYDLALISHKQLSPDEMTKFIERSNKIMMLLTK